MVEARNVERILEPGRLSLASLADIRDGAAVLALSPETRTLIAEGAEAVARIAKKGAVYGINTGFGKLAQTRIDDDKLDRLQRNLVLSHAAGTGPSLPARVVKLILALKVNSLARGHSGVRPLVVERLVDLLRADALPVIPAQGSVGASGDLAPLAHMTMALLGEGEIDFRGERKPAAVVLSELGLEPFELAAKEGLALLNGTQVSTALALDGLFRAEKLFRAALTIGALSVDALMGSDDPFDGRIHVLRGHPGQIAVAAIIRDLLAGSEIRESHRDCERVQDPYSLRCQPQVMGACLDQIRDVAERLLREANAVTDNPLIFPDQDEALSGGNFHAEPVALAADNLALAVAEIGALSERRIALLIDAALSEGLPPFLVEEPGLNSGFMIAQVTAAALASENKQRAMPASVDSLPTSANQEDHVSMATHGARRLAEMTQNTGGILAVELLAACQGIDFRRPLKSSAPLEDIHRSVRAQVPFYAEDRYFAPDIESASKMVLGDLFTGIGGALFE